MYDKEFKFIFDYAKNKVDDIEILLSADNSFSTKIDQQKIDSFSYADSKGLSVRVIKDGKTGYAYTEKFDDEAFQMIVDEALENAKYDENDEVAVMENHPDIDIQLAMYNEKLNEVEIDEKISFTKDLERYAKEADDRVFNVPFAVYGDATSYVKIANSQGLDKEEKQNSAFCYVGALTQQDEDKRVGLEFAVGRDFSKFNAKILAEESVAKSTALLGGETIESGNYPVVFNNEMMATMLATFSSVFSAKSVQEGRSMLVGKLGQKVADEKVIIVDDAVHPAGTASRRFDSEGYPSQTTTLIENGILKSFFHNTETARKDGVKSTGNGSRSYKGSLGIASSNFILKAGENKEEELFASKDKIIEIVALQGMHSGANTISGDFSLSGEGFLYENGKRKHSLKQFTVSGNFLKMLNDVEMIADNFKFNMSSFGASSVLIKELAISG